MASFWKNILGFVAGEKLFHVVDGLKAKVEETIEEMEERIERATIKALKASLLFVIMFVGVIFLLVGLAQHLNATVPNLANGLGTVLVGALLVFMALFARMFRN